MDSLCPYMSVLLHKCCVLPHFITFSLNFIFLFRKLRSQNKVNDSYQLPGSFNYLLSVLWFIRLRHDTKHFELLLFRKRLKESTKKLLQFSLLCFCYAFDFDTIGVLETKIHIKKNLS